MSLVPGTRLGPYEIVAPLGAGGMGEVYRARDTRLGREVAIKILPEAFAADPERIARFEREARLLASLHHPNIAAIHGLEESDGQRFIVMECVEGGTLADRLASGPLPVPEALEIGRQIAMALEAAHEGGVIHRDLKPANVQLTPAGDVRVLDFGLAKGDVAASSTSNLTHSPTLTGAMTEIGIILGTAAYMSPEQARGKPVDRRTDIWSFGAVLFECLSGRQCFAGETLSDTIAMILQRDPDWDLLPRTTPARIRRLLARCLERDPRKRLRDIGEARIELEAVLASGAAGDPVPEGAGAAAVRAGSLRGLALVLLAGALLGGALGAWWVARGPATGAHVPVVRYPILMPANKRMTIENFTTATDWDVSPDGRFVAARLRGRFDPTGASSEGLSENSPVFVRRLADSEWRMIPGSERATGPVAFVPDGKSLYFLSRISDESRDLRLLRAGLEDGAVANPVCDLPDEARSARPQADGRVVLLSFDGARIAIRRPGAGAALTWRPIQGGPGFTGIDFEASAPGAQLSDHEWFVGRTTYGRDGWHRGTAILNLETLKLEPVLEDGQWPVLLPSGQMCFSRGTALMAVKFDRRTHKVAGDAVPLMDGMRTRGSWLPARFRLTAAGDLVFAPDGAVGEHRTLEHLDVHGTFSQYSPGRRAFNGTVGADAAGRHVAVGITNARGFDEIWTFDGPGQQGQRTIQLQAADASSPVVSPDGRWIAFAREGNDSLTGIYLSPFTGAAEPRPVFIHAKRDTFFRAIAWLHDDRHLLCRGGTGGRNVSVIVDTQAPEGASPRVRMNTAYNMTDASISPDGRFITFSSDHTGHAQLFVAPISVEQGIGSAVAIAPTGFAPVWAADGKGVFYPDTASYRYVGVSTANGISASPPRTLFRLDTDPERIFGGFDLADGSEILLLRAPEDLQATKLEVVQNWLRSVATKLPK